MRLDFKKEEYPTIGDLTKKLFEDSFDDVLCVNENDSIDFVTREGEIFVRYNFFYGSGITKLADLFEFFNGLKDRTTLKLSDIESVKILQKSVEGEWNNYLRISKEKIKEILNYENFSGYLLFLVSIFGEYGGNIFHILQDKENWIVIFERMEDVPGKDQIIFYSLDEEEIKLYDEFWKNS